MFGFTSLPSLASLLAVGAVAALIIRHVYNSWCADVQLRYIPTHTFEQGGNSRERYLTDLKLLLESGYRKYTINGKPFKVLIPIGGYSVKYRVILPKDHLEEIKHQSNNTFSWQLASRIIFAQDYTGAPDRGPWSGKALRVGIHQNLGDITKQLDLGISNFFDSYLPQRQGTTSSINLMDFFVPCIATVTNALLVGPRLSSDPEWVRQTADFAVNRYAAADDVRKWPPYIARVVSPFIPKVRRLRQQREYAREKMKPLYENLKSQEALDTASKAQHRKGAFGYDWLWGGAPEEITLDDFSDTIMRTLIASIHTTAKTMTIALIDLLTQPEYLNEIKMEAQSAQGDHGQDFHLDKLFKLDCFLKESQRLSPVFLMTMNRIVTEDYTFKCSGLRLPKGTMVSAAAAAVATDPKVFDEPNSFDGRRYVKLREQNKEKDSSLIMGMSTIDSLGFGLGNQACPGRFLAVNNLKLMLAKLLVGWDIELEKNGIRYCGERLNTQYNDFSAVPPGEYSIRLTRI